MTHATPPGIDPAIYAQALADVRALTSRYNHGYVPVNQRPRAWRLMASELAAAGRTTAQIAADLCVSEDTVHALLGTTTVHLAA